MILLHNVPLITLTGMIEDFKKLLRRDDLETLCISYDTTFDMGDFYLSVLTYRQTEFEETPVIPLIFMIHEKKFESIHDFFFQRLTELVPELSSSSHVVIVSDEETSIVNSIKKHLPDVPRFRCWLHTLQCIKRKLRSLGIVDKKTLQEFKTDFINLLNQESSLNYKTLLANLYLTKWKNKVNVQTFNVVLVFIPLSFSRIFRSTSPKKSTLTWKIWVHGLFKSLECQSS